MQIENRQITSETLRPKAQKKTFEIVTSAGKLFIEVNALSKYFFVVVAYAGLLKIDGSLQVAYPTPYSSNPTVVNLTAEVQSSPSEIAKTLSKELGCPVVLSINISFQMNKKGEEEVLSALKQILKSI